ncbi:hypothetical protein V1477_003175 [Vespula maculifrons]|uniref:Uncharacterized protein n=1 Tax=Vespula maculifrons TaxID=7453 RepID=A0ABD2CTW4_VESMC
MSETGIGEESRTGEFARLAKSTIRPLPLPRSPCLFSINTHIGIHCFDFTVMLSLLLLVSTLSTVFLCSLVLNMDIDLRSSNGRAFVRKAEGQYCIECCALLLEAECYCESLNWINSFISVVTGYKRSVGKFGLEKLRMLELVLCILYERIHRVCSFTMKTFYTAAFKTRTKRKE